MSGAGAAACLGGESVHAGHSQHERSGTQYGDRDFFRELVATGKPLITEPLTGRRTGVPVITIAVPIFSPDKRMIGAVLGITNMGKPNFLDQISRAKYGLTGDFFVTPPRLVYDLEARLRGAHIDELPQLVRDFFRQAGAEVLSVTPEDFIAALQDALGDAPGNAAPAAPESP